MTPENTKQPYENNLESIISAISGKIDQVDKTARHIYNSVADLIGRAEDIYDAIAYHRDSPTYHPDMDEFGTL